MTTTATIKAKGTQATGITEQMLDRLQLGSKLMAIVELAVDAHTENSDGDEKLAISILTLEPAPTLLGGAAADHLRNLQRSFFYERQLKDGQSPLPLDGDGIEPKVADVLASRPGLLPHPYLSSQLALDNTGDAGPVCDICGLIEGAPIHHMPDTDPFTIDDTDDAGDAGEDPDGEEDEDTEEDGDWTNDGGLEDATTSAELIAPEDDVQPVEKTDPYGYTHHGRFGTAQCGLPTPDDAGADGNRRLITTWASDKVSCPECLDLMANS